MGTNGAALTNYDPLIDAVGDIRARNYEPNAFIIAPRTDTVLIKLKDTTNSRSGLRQSSRRWSAW